MIQYTGAQEVILIHSLAKDEMVYVLTNNACLNVGVLVWRTEKVNSRLLREVNCSSQQCGVVGGSQRNRKFVMDELNARRGQCHCIFNILVEYIPSSRVVAPLKFEAC